MTLQGPGLIILCLQVPTLGASIVQIVLSVAQIILVFVLPSLYDKNSTPDRRFGSFSLLIYTHGAHWAAFLIIDQFLHHHHHKSRLMGYLEFYVKVYLYLLQSNGEYISRFLCLDQEYQEGPVLHSLHR